MRKPKGSWTPPTKVIGGMGLLGTYENPDLAILDLVACGSCMPALLRAVGYREHLTCQYWRAFSVNALLNTCLSDTGHIHETNPAQFAAFISRRVVFLICVASASAVAKEADALWGLAPVLSFRTKERPSNYTDLRVDGTPPPPHFLSHLLSNQYT